MIVGPLGYLSRFGARVGLVMPKLVFVSVTYTGKWASMNKNPKYLMCNYLLRFFTFYNIHSIIRLQDLLKRRKRVYTKSPFYGLGII